MIFFFKKFISLRDALSRSFYSLLLQSSGIFIFNFFYCGVPNSPFVLRCFTFGTCKIRCCLVSGRFVYFTISGRSFILLL